MCLNKEVTTVKLAGMAEENIISQPLVFVETLTKIDSLISSCLSDTGSVKGKLSVCLAVMINSLVESTSSAGCSHTLHLFSQVDLDSHVCCFVL